MLCIYILKYKDINHFDDVKQTENYIKQKLKTLCMSCPFCFVPYWLRNISRLMSY